MKYRLRLAPSPTGFLHIGNLRSALFNYFYAKKSGATLILRIEDTDQKRFVDGSIESLYDILDWIGIGFDEGPIQGGEYGPYIQSQRTEIYHKHLEDLLVKGHAYHCFCTPERLEEMRSEQTTNKQAPRYDRKCRDLEKNEVAERIAKGEKYVIRQKMPLTGEVKVMDELRGEITYPAADLEDHVLIKSNGIPTYHFASVVDDHLMKITHVTRGEEWIPSLPKNILLYRAFEWEPPKFIHYPNILSKHGGKLSKRHDDVSVESYRTKGYLKEALVNFCALMGWHPKNDSEIMTIDEIISQFELQNIGLKGPIFDTDKLDYLNGYYIRQKDLVELTKLCIPYFIKDALIVEEDGNLKNKAGEKIDFDFLKDVVSLERERIKKLSEIGEATEFFFKDELSYEHGLLVWKKSTPEETKTNLKKTIEILENIDEGNWTRASIEEAMMNHIKTEEAGVGNYLWPLRASLSGRKASPGPFELAEVLSKTKTLARINQAITKL